MTDQNSQNVETSVDQWNKAIDEWIESEKKEVGRVTKLTVGMYPPNWEDSTEFGINNRLASADLIRHYADAIGDINPLWRSEDYARNTKYGGIIAPPKFITCIAPTYGIGRSPGIPGFGGLNGGAKTIWYKTIHAGDEFSVHDRFLGIREVTRKDRPLPRIIIRTSKRTYINQRDEIVAVNMSNGIGVGSPPGHQRGEAFPQNKRRRYSDEEIEEISRSYDQEKRRGSDTLFWEDVKEGEGLPSLVKGPLDVYDSVAFFVCVGYTAAFRVKDIIMRSRSRKPPRDPETNAPLFGAGIHVDDKTARTDGVPYAIGFAAQSEGNIVHMICNWMGDDGFLKELDCQSRRINILGDMNWIKGKVTRKYIENDETLVDLEVWAENQDGIIHMPGKATVRLLSRTYL